MGTRLIYFIVLLILTILDLGPFPLVSLAGLYVVLMRPIWFKSLVDDIYGDRKP
ncbi:hypothetical protein [Methylomagnum sp.]